MADESHGNLRGSGGGSSGGPSDEVVTVIVSGFDSCA